ncbi:MAG TPA: class I SAM-dependent methyltransferase [Bacteroidales bacterium]|nr:class I SAM-dependent methyltransferase [Bacteroidales bacterium]
MNDFDIKAAEWDKNPVHRKISEAVVNKMIAVIPLKKNMTVLEYGAGTGITSLLLKDYVREITLMDNSAEMVKVTNKNIEAAKVKNLKALNFNLECTDYINGKFDLIFAQLVLHHVIDHEALINRLSLLLNPGGYLALADLYKEDGSFHGKGFTGHNGFDPEELSDILRKDKFQNIRHSHCYTISKDISDTETREFDMFLLTALRP